MKVVLLAVILISSLVFCLGFSPWTAVLFVSFAVIGCFLKNKLFKCFVGILGAISFGFMLFLTFGVSVSVIILLFCIFGGFLGVKGVLDCCRLFGFLGIVLSVFCFIFGGDSLPVSPDYMFFISALSGQCVGITCGNTVMKTIIACALGFIMGYFVFLRGGVFGNIYLFCGLFSMGALFTALISDALHSIYRVSNNG